MNKSIDLTVIVPAYNEERGLSKLLPELIASCEARNWKLIVVNDCSSDNTAEVLEQYSDQITVLHNDINLGYGASIKRGLRLVKTTWVATFDGDGQHRIKDLINMSELAHDCDAVFGQRTSSSHYCLSRVPGKRILRSIVQFLVGHRILDINCGLRIFRRSALKPITHLTSDSFSFSISSLVAFLKSGYHIVFFPVTTSARVGNSSVNQIRDGLRIVLFVVRLIMLFDPMRVIVPVAVVSLLTGVVYQLWSFAVYGFNLNDATLLFVIVGVVLFVLALVADQISALRRELTLQGSDDE